MNSGTVLTGTEGCTSMAKGSRAMLATGAMSRMKLKLRLSQRVALTAFTKVATRSVYPSGGAFTTISVPILLADPGRFSITNCWPSRSRQPLSYQACHDVGATSGGKSDNDVHGRAG